MKKNLQWIALVAAVLALGLGVLLPLESAPQQVGGAAPVVVIKSHVISSRPGDTSCAVESTCVTVNWETKAPADVLVTGYHVTVKANLSTGAATATADANGHATSAKVSFFTATLQGVTYQTTVQANYTSMVSTNASGTFQ